MSTSLKLQIELVPSTSWYNNMRSLIPKAQWDRLRKKIYSDFHYKCGICNKSGMLHCHEVWQYDDLQHIQKLTGFIALCPLCHRVKHIGLAQIQASEGKLNFDEIVKHFMQVNGCTQDVFEKHMHEAFKRWEERSKYQWQLEITGIKVE